MRKPPKYYLKNISRRWQTEIKKVDDKVIILSPYLTSKTAEAVLRGSKFTECEIYTIFSVHNFVSGASSLKTLKNLHQRGCNLYHLPRLHAKIVIAPGRFATIGSQNLTQNGVKNKEATVITFDKEEVKEIEKMLDRWLPQRKSITSEMLNELEGKVTNLRRKFGLINRELRKEINDLENEIWENQDERLENERLAKEAKEAEELRRVEEEVNRLRDAQLQDKLRRQQEERRKQVVNAARTRVQQLSTHGEIDRELAKEFISNSAYWNHPKAHRLVRAPGHATNIYGSRNNWRIDFGANSFLVGHAIYRCQQTLLEFLEKAESGYVMPIPELREKLELIVQGAVANHKGYEYEGYYSAIYDNFIMFGAQAINVCDFVNLVLRKAKLGEVFQINNF
jgi:hypothetical protein